MTKALLIVIVLLLLSCAGLWIRALQLDASNIQLESDKQILNDNISQYEMTLQSQNGIIITLENSVDNINELLNKQYNHATTLEVQLDAKKRALNEIIVSNPGAKDWASQRVPADISRLFLQLDSESAD